MLNYQPFKTYMIMDMSLKYRADIDGLRAIAVLLVVLFHAKLPIPGGFVGVDVFFVISGFLITSILDKEIRESRFSYVSFYVRRIKRLIPALFFMLIIVAAYCSYYLMPEDLISFGKTSVLSMLGVSNFYFYIHTNYFESSSSEPLLHTWSLAVEEQYYIFWPLILMMIYKIKRTSIKAALFSALFVTSVLLSWYYVHQDKNMAYMMLPFRFFELMTGALVAINYRRTESILKYSNALSVSGLILILASAFLLNENSSFPGVLALPVSIGSAMLIASREGIVNKLLSLKPIVYIGRVSYSFYLWHWPVIILAIYRGVELTNVNALGLVVFSFVMASISYHFIENPFRKLKSPFIVFPVLYLSPLICCILFMNYMNKTEGLKWRMEGMFDELNDSNSAHIVRNKCMEKMNIGNFDECYLGVKKDYPDAIMIGDSFGNAAAPFIDVLAKNAGLMIHDTMRSTTPSVPGVYVTRIGTSLPDDQIKQVLRYTTDRIKYGMGLKMVIISDFFDQYDQNNPAFPVYDKEGKVINEKVFSMRESMIKDLIDHGVQVVLVARPFRSIGPSGVAKLREMKMRHVIPSTVRIPLKETRDSREEYRLKREFPQIKLIDFNDVLCNEVVCSPFVGNDIIFRKDGSHLNYTSAIKLGEAYLSELGNPLK